MTTRLQSSILQSRRAIQALRTLLSKLADAFYQPRAEEAGVYPKLNDTSAFAKDDETSGADLSTDLLLLACTGVFGAHVQVLACDSIESLREIADCLPLQLH